MKRIDCWNIGEQAKTGRLYTETSETVNRPKNEIEVVKLPMRFKGNLIEQGKR